MISEKELQAAARKCEKAMMASLPDPDECDAVFSPKFERKMKKLILQTDHPFRYWIQKSVACFLLIVLLGGGGLLTFSTEVRAAFFGWIREVYETYFVYHYEGENQDTSENIFYNPTWVPDGYEIILKKIGPVNTNITYQNSDGNLASFLYTTNSESTKYWISREGVDVQRVFVGNYPADLYLDQEKEGGNVLIWVDEEKNTIFDIWATFSIDEMIKMAESIEPQKKE